MDPKIVLARIANHVAHMQIFFIICECYSKYIKKLVRAFFCRYSGYGSCPYFSVEKSTMYTMLVQVRPSRFYTLAHIWHNGNVLRNLFIKVFLFLNVTDSVKTEKNAIEEPWPLKNIINNATGLNKLLLLHQLFLSVHLF